MKLFCTTKLVISIFIFAFFCCIEEIQAAKIPDDKFNEAYVKIATEVSSSDMNRAFKMSDSLFASTSDKFQKMKCLMLLAMLHQRSGNIAKSLAFATKAEDMLSDDEKYQSWRVRIPGFLSTLFRGVNLTEQARKYLGIAEVENLKQKPSQDRTVTQALILQEKAYYAIEEDQNYKLALTELSEAEKKFAEAQNQPSRNVFLGTNNQLTGLCYFKTKDYDKAKAYYLKAITELETTDTELKAYIYCGLGDVALEKRQYQEALQYFKKAEPYANNSNNFNAKIMFNRCMASYYRATGDSKSALAYQEHYSTLLDKQAETTKVVSNQLFKEMNAKQNNYYTLAETLVVILITLLALVIFLIYLNKQNNKKNRIKYEQIRKKLEFSDTVITKENELVRKSDLIAKNEPQSIMTIESEKRLLDSLSKMESKNFFLRGDVSLSSVSSRLNSNTKYTSYIINKYKGKDFNNYVNDLRINYALNDLRLYPEVRRYKISYLANKYGFSSHSKFAAIFKSTTGITPSVFIENLKIDEDVVSMD